MKDAQKIKSFLEYVLESIVEEKDKISINAIQKENILVLQVKVSKNDRGRVIGKNGKMIKSLRRLLSIFSAGTDQRIALELLE